MGVRVPNSGGTDLMGAIIPWVGVQKPLAGAGFHVCAEPTQAMPVGDYAALKAALAGGDLLLAEAIMSTGPAAPFWAKVQRKLAAAYPGIRPSEALLRCPLGPALWHAPGPAGPL